MLKKNSFESFISISSNPGKFGETVHNAGFNHYKLNFHYRSLRVTNLSKTIESFKTLNLRGMSVSMPFKIKVIKYLDKLDKSAKLVGAVNTILRDETKLIGYNTDIYGAGKAIDNLNIEKNERILLFGAGGVARAIIIALKKRNIKKITITNRNNKRARELSKKFNCEYEKWNDLTYDKFDVLINATPIGMADKSFKELESWSFIDQFSKIMDVVVKKNDTLLIRKAKKLKIKNVNGLLMTFHQAAKQFELYTEKKAPLKIMLDAYNNFNKSSFKI